MQQPKKGSPEDIAFAEVLGQLMRGTMGAPDAVRQLSRTASCDVFNIH